MLDTHDKFWAFGALLVSIMVLAWLSNGATTFVMVDGKPVSVANGSILRDAMVGLIAVLGTAAQALFRTSETAKQMNDLLSRTVEQLGKSVPPPPPPPNHGVPKDVEEAANQVADAAAEEAAPITNASEATETPPRGGSKDA